MVKTVEREDESEDENDIISAWEEFNNLYETEVSIRYKPSEE
jgi:hypothetical protein